LNNIRINLISDRIVIVFGANVIKKELILLFNWMREVCRSERQKLIEKEEVQ
jgi:hypothetical protein